MAQGFLCASGVLGSVLIFFNEMGEEPNIPLFQSADLRPFGTEPFGRELRVERLKAEGLPTGCERSELHSNLSKKKFDIMYFFCNHLFRFFQVDEETGKHEKFSQDHHYQPKKSRSAPRTRPSIGRGMPPILIMG